MFQHISVRAGQLHSGRASPKEKEAHPVLSKSSENENELIHEFKRSSIKWTNGVGEQYLAYFSSFRCSSSATASANNFLSWATSSRSFAFLCTARRKRKEPSLDNNSLTCLLLSTQPYSLNCASPYSLPDSRVLCCICQDQRPWGGYGADKELLLTLLLYLLLPGVQDIFQ